MKKERAGKTVQTGGTSYKVVTLRMENTCLLKMIISVF